MTEAARYNLQHGVPENRNYEHTTYIAESALDRYILAKIDARRIILDKQNYDNMIESASNDILKIVTRDLQRFLM